jgi:hypothetical protein
MKIHQLEASEAFQSLQSCPDGLTDSEALRRLAEYGRNEIPEIGGESPLVMLL